MHRKLDAVLDGLAAAGLVAVIVGVCLTAVDYLVLVAGERMLERWSVLPSGWGDAHQAALALAAFLIALGPAALVGWWIFRSAPDGDGAAG